MFSVEGNDSCKTLTSVIPKFSIYTYTFNVIKKENSLSDSALTRVNNMIKLHFVYDEFVFI